MSARGRNENILSVDSFGCDRFPKVGSLAAVVLATMSAVWVSSRSNKGKASARLDDEVAKPVTRKKNHKTLTTEDAAHLETEQEEVYELRGRSHRPSGSRNTSGARDSTITSSGKVSQTS